MQHSLSPKRLAEAIGVSESSLKRWADEGRLEVRRTAGGHRRIALREAIRFIRETGLPVVNPVALGLPDLAALQSAEAPAEPTDPLQALHRTIVDGEAERVRGLMLWLYLNGHDLASICDGPVCRAMRELGELWRHGTAGIHLEHHATEICLQALNQLRGLLPPLPADAPLAIGGTTTRDPTLLGSLMAAAVLAEAGWRTVNLGPDLPPEALTDAVGRYQPTLVWLGCSLHGPALESHKLTQLARAASRTGASLVVGGPGWPRPLPARHPALHTVSSMGELLAFTHGLRRGADQRGRNGPTAEPD